MDYGSVYSGYYRSLCLNSSKMVESIYYAPDDGEIVCTEDILNLHQGIPYNFLIKLD